MMGQPEIIILSCRRKDYDCEIARHDILKDLSNDKPLRAFDIQAIEMNLCACDFQCTCLFTFNCVPHAWSTACLVSTNCPKHSKRNCDCKAWRCQMFEIGITSCATTHHHTRSAGVGTNICHRNVSLTKCT